MAIRATATGATGAPFSEVRFTSIEATDVLLRLSRIHVPGWTARRPTETTITWSRARVRRGAAVLRVLLWPLVWLIGWWLRRPLPVPMRSDLLTAGFFATEGGTQVIVTGVADAAMAEALLLVLDAWPRATAAPGPDPA